MTINTKDTRETQLKIQDSNTRHEERIGTSFTGPKDNTINNWIGVIQDHEFHVQQQKQREFIKSIELHVYYYYII